MSLSIYVILYAIFVLIFMFLIGIFRKIQAEKRTKKLNEDLKEFNEMSTENKLNEIKKEQSFHMPTEFVIYTLKNELNNLISKLNNKCGNLSTAVYLYNENDSFKNKWIYISISILEEEIELITHQIESTKTKIDNMNKGI